MTLPEVLSHLSFMLLLFFILPTKQVACPGRALLLVLAGGLSFVTIGGLSLGDYTRSYADELSMLSVLWLLYAGLSHIANKPVVPARHQTQLAILVALMGVILYPAALGLSFIDPYRWGYSPDALLLAAFSICLIWLWLRNYFALAIMTAATLLFMLDIKSSDNYWDYLVDPLVWIYCCGHLLKIGVRRAWRRRPRRAADSEPAYVAREA
jgi:hypothetical protein